jgi:SAM-dependent methyltransferase
MSTPPNDAAGAYFRARFTEDPRRADLWRHLTAYLARFVPKDAAVLELGAGYCYFINQIPAARRVAVDVGPQVRSAAAAGVEVREGDALTYLGAAPPAEFDFILASNFLEHLEWPELNALLPLLLRVLRPGGRLALIQPNFRLAPGRYFDDYTHRTVFSDVSLRDWLTSGGFRILVETPRFLPLTVKSRLGSLSFLVPLYLRMPWRPLAGQMFVLAERPVSAGSAG